MRRSARGCGAFRRWRGGIIFALAAGSVLAAEAVWAGGGAATGQVSSEIVDQANAPISSIFQIRLLDGYAPSFTGHLHGQGNLFTVALTMPLPRYRLLPIPQLSLLTIPVAATLPLPTGDLTAFGDVRFLDLAIFDLKHSLLFGIGPNLVFPTANTQNTGQGKWQAGPAAALAFVPRGWLIGVLAQNPISFGGDPGRPRVNALILQPFISYQLGHGWFVRSEPQMIFDWQTGRQLLPLDFGVGRVFAIGPQLINCYIEPSWNVSHDLPAPAYAITVGIALLYPNFWARHAGR